MPNASLPVACTLSGPEKREREATLIAQVKSGVIGVEELEDGYAFRLPGDQKWLLLVTEVMAAERDCCPFLKFQLIAEPAMGALMLRITGPEGTQEFLQSVLL